MQAFFNQLPITGKRSRLANQPVTLLFIILVCFGTIVSRLFWMVLVVFEVQGGVKTAPGDVLERPDRS